MDEWGDDAYPVIFEEDERPLKTSGGSCCGGLFVFVMIGLALVISESILIF